MLLPMCMKWLYWTTKTLHLLLATALIAIPIPSTADLIERGYLLSIDTIRQLSKDDQTQVFEAMNEDIKNLPVVRDRLPEPVQNLAPTIENLYDKYSRFRDFCHQEFARWIELADSNVCLSSFYLSMKLSEAIVEKSDFRLFEAQALIKNDSRIYESFSAKNYQDKEPQIWSYIYWFNSLSGGELDWRSVEGYVCTENDPLALRVEPEHGSDIVDLMPRKSPIIIHDYLPFMDWTYVQYGEFRGYAHTSFICMGNAREPVFSEEQQQRNHSHPDFYNYVQNSKCDHRDYPDTFIGPAGGDRRLWLNVCNDAKGTAPRWCMDMTCPNQAAGEASAFRQLYGKNVPHQLIPDAQQFGTGIELVRIVTRLEKEGVCIDKINNWHRPKSYNNHPVVGGEATVSSYCRGGC